MERLPKGSLWGLGMLFNCLSAILGCTADGQQQFERVEYPVIKLSDRAVEILPGTGALKAPVLSPDGNRLAVQVELYRDSVLPYEIYSVAASQKNQDGEWEPALLSRPGVHKRYLGRMEMANLPSFDHTGQSIIYTHIQLGSFLSIPSALSLRSWIGRIPWGGGEAKCLLKPEDLKLAPSELLQHPRISPDGNWLTFYTRMNKKYQGIYLWNMKTSQQIRVSSNFDKHPTWSPDGKRIYFHHQIGGGRHRFDLFADQAEHAVLGFIELEFDASGKLASWQRHLLDDVDDRFIYHKHPTEVYGTNLLFFHGQLKPEGKKKLMVRRAEPGSQVYVVKPKWSEGKLKELKHPCSSWQKADLVFLARGKGAKRYNLLMMLTDQALGKIKQALHDGAELGVDAPP